MKKITLIFLFSPLILICQNYQLDSITGSNGLLIYSVYDNYGNAINDYYQFSTINWKYENSYDLNNNKVETIIYENDGGFWIEYQKYIYIYNNSVITSSETYSWNINSWTVVQKSDYYYDLNNNLEYIESSTWNNNNWTLVNRTTYSYINNNQIEYIYSTWDGSNWQYSTKVERDFYNNNIQEEEFFSYQNGSWSSVYTSEYTCNNNQINNTKYGLSLADFTHFENQVTELEYSFGDTYTFHYSIATFTTPIHDLINSKKKLLLVIDILGKKNKSDTYKPLIYLYDDGSVKRRMIIK